MARPRKTSYNERTWPKITECPHRHGSTASYLVDTLVTVGDQGRIRRRFRTRTLAETFATKLRVERENHGAAAFDLSEGQRLDAKEALRLLAPLGVSLAAAAAFYLRHARPAGGDITLSDLVQRFLAEKRDRANLRADSLTNLSVRLGRFNRSFADGLLVKDMAREDIARWLSEAASNPRTFINDRAVLNNLFTFAVRERFLAENPVASIRKPKMDDKVPAILSNGDVAALLRAAATDCAASDLLGYVVLGAFCGIRPAELRRLRWENVNLRTGNVKVVIAKQRRAAARNIPLPAAAVEWLLRCERKPGPVCPAANFQKNFRALYKSAAMTAWPKDCLRHTFASNCYARTGNAALTASYMGHRNSTDVLFNHYVDLVNKEDAESYFALSPAMVLGETNVVPLAAVRA